MAAGLAELRYESAGPPVYGGHCPPDLLVPKLLFRKVHAAAWERRVTFWGNRFLRNWWAVPTLHYLTQGRGAFTLQFDHYGSVERREGQQ